MKTWSKILLGVVLAGGAAWSWHMVSTSRAPSLSQPVAAAGFAPDAQSAWTASWVAGGIPKALHNSQGWIPWIVANPKSPQQSWWIWPLLEGNKVWFGQSTPGGVQWDTASLNSPTLSLLPTPWQTMLEWGRRLQQNGPAPKSVTVTPAGSWGQERGKAGAVTGFMMAMQPRARTIVLALLLHGKTSGWIELVGIWQWDQRWAPRYLILNPVPSQVSRRDLLMPPNHGVPLELPAWTKSSA